MLASKYLALPILLAAQCLAAVSNEDTPCSSACGKWSEVVKTCYDQFGTSPHTNGYAFSNQFLACLCTGKSSSTEGDYGNATMNQVAGVCQSCSTTPNNIKSDLSAFLGLCAIQAQNGSAANASTYAPLGYKTGDEANQGSDASNNSGALIGAIPSPVAITGIFGVLITSVFTAM